MRCERCGDTSPDTHRFCRRCGARLGPETAAPASEGRSREELEQERVKRWLEEAFRLSEEGKVLAAIEACQQAVAAAPNSTSAHSLLGTLFERQGEREKAIREYETVLSLSPGSTADRRRLNELLGVPAAREEAAAVTPRRVRLVIAGSFGGAVLLLLIAIIAVVVRPGSVGRRGGLPSAQQSLVQAGTVAVLPAAGAIPAPGGAASPLFSFPAFPSVLPAPALSLPGISLPAAAPLPEPSRGAVIIAPGGRQHFPGLSPVYSVLPRAPLPIDVGPLLAARAGGPSGVSSPVPRAGPGVIPAGTFASPQLAQAYYFNREYDKAVQVYQQLVASAPSPAPQLREELAWVYHEAGETGRATETYRAALASYRALAASGEGSEAAAHGIRTCEAALRALESR
jgi:tetratricopeptide (TPR) repeat protein